MTKHVVEYGGIPVGILVPDQNCLRFIAVKFHVHPLDGHHFSSSMELHQAIHALMTRNDRPALAA